MRKPESFSNSPLVSLQEEEEEEEAAAVKILSNINIFSMECWFYAK